jgi:moderate conductance mechanosensitive channel
MTAYEQITGNLTLFWNHLAGLGPQGLAINAGLTALILVAAFLIIKGLNWLMCQTVSHLPGESSDERKKRAGKALKLSRTVVGLVVWLIAFFMVANVWGIDIIAWASEGSGRHIASTTLRVLAVLVLATLAVEAVGLFTRKTLNRLRREGDPRRGAQLDTLGPLVRRLLQVVIIGLAIITLLSQVGVEIAPVLAGAGVVGVAVGFGAQTIVKDMLTGLFLILEDIVAVGDIVQIGAFSGEVEDMTLRTIRLRGSDGTLHIFPYGESQVIHNMTKTFSYAASDLPVKYDTDIDHAMQVMREAAADLRKDPAYGPLILADLEIAGVDLLSDVGVIIKSRMRTQPTSRWKVLREYNKRIKKAFDAAGIQITHK